MITTQQLKHIADLADSVPEAYRPKCFELLLQNALGSFPKNIQEDRKPPVDAEKSNPLPIDVKAFLSQFSINESALSNLFLMEGKQVRPVYKIKTKKKAAAQIQYALLLALEDAIATGEFKFSIESLRQRCKEHHVFDSANFMATLKSKISLFRSIDDESAVFLSPTGKEQLADAIEEISNGKD